MFDMISKANTGMKNSQACSALKGVGNRYLISPFYQHLDTNMLPLVVLRTNDILFIEYG